MGSLSSDNLWPSWHEIEGLRGNRAIVLYGRSEDWVHKAMRSLPIPAHAIVDNNPAYLSTTYMGLPVMSIEGLGSPDQYFYIITAGQFDGIVESLLALGLNSREDFVCTPDNRDYQKLVDLRALNPSLLVSSSDYRDSNRARSSSLGGGLYLMDLAQGGLSCVYEGSTRQIVRLPGGKVATVDYVSKELLFFDKDFVVETRVDLGAAKSCGLAYSHSSGLIFVANAGRDTISVFEAEEKRLTCMCLNMLSSCLALFLAKPLLRELVAMAIGTPFAAIACR